MKFVALSGLRRCIGPKSVMKYQLATPLVNTYVRLVTGGGGTGILKEGVKCRLASMLGRTFPGRGAGLFRSRFKSAVEVCLISCVTG